MNVNELYEKIKELNIYHRTIMYILLEVYEDGVLNGGVGSEILEFMSEKHYQIQVERMGIPDQFVEHGTPNELYEMLGLDAKSIYKKIVETLKK